MATRKLSVGSILLVYSLVFRLLSDVLQATYCKRRIASDVLQATNARRLGNEASARRQLRPMRAAPIPTLYVCPPPLFSISGSAPAQHVKVSFFSLIALIGITGSVCDAMISVFFQKTHHISLIRCQG